LSTLANAKELVEFIASKTHGLAIPGTLRSRVAVACLGVALDHHHAITILISERRFASSFALTRLLFESFLRGAWITNCASDDHVEKLSTGCEPPKVDILLSELESTQGYTCNTLSAIKANSWRSMCSYAHTGGLQIQRWQTESSVEPRYDADEISEVLSFANLVASLAAVELVGISGSESRFEELTRSLGSYLPPVTQEAQRGEPREVGPLDSPLSSALGSPSI
jgi:hypothetical protein